MRHLSVHHNKPEFKHENVTLMKITLIILLSGLVLCGCTKKQATNDYPKASWVFAGYASPDSALESWIWALSKGDKTVMLQSLTPEAQKEGQKKLAVFSDDPNVARAQGLGLDSQLGYTIRKREIVSNDEVVLHITTGGSKQVRTYDMRKIGSEWKLVAGPNFW
jgi:hypothetical protein